MEKMKFLCNARYMYLNVPGCWQVRCCLTAECNLMVTDGLPSRWGPRGRWFEHRRDPACVMLLKSEGDLFSGYGTA